MDTMDIAKIGDLCGRVGRNIARVIVGKEDVIDLSLVALLAGGHLLLEDVPGTGKTVLAKSLARSVGVEFRRVQFTPDLLPSDLTGIQYYNQKQSEFIFRKGPVFTHILLADEINRATPRTQSSLLECMEERQVTADGVTHPLEDPYFVIATQNPVETQGTFPLPEAQLDRFLIRTSVGYPTPEQSADMLRRFLRDDPLASLSPVCGREELLAARAGIRAVYTGEELIGYIVEIVERTRRHAAVRTGVSPRGAIALLHAAQAAAALHSRSFVSPEDVKRLAVPVLAHRLILREERRAAGESAESVVASILSDVPAPTEEWPEPPAAMRKPEA